MAWCAGRVLRGNPAGAAQAAPLRWGTPALACARCPMGAEGLAFQVFFLACVMVAGVYGAMTASKKILFIQTVPAALALAAVLAA